ncbi:hypothetical protein N7519_006568 [Penicillium mononematosum]|uniref:uncharacterized protein n=1 Tax=Penicillium mononematosum TaxID=268346 RepID=UPI002549BD30|nr:uncharacterized protein N7519_006568 [Penicillium mononematosum]KAJ6185267.1 hypothetical protein N7519_006568 [Penicillium mononematosum]
MTGDLDFAFHGFPGGEVYCGPVEAFGYEYGRGEYEDDDDACTHWNSSFLNADIAVVTIAGENSDKEWCRYSIDLRTGTPLAHFEGHSCGRDDFEPLGDDTWIVSGTDGSTIRRCP